jgi:hypothetical protein
MEKTRKSKVCKFNNNYLCFLSECQEDCIVKTNMYFVSSKGFKCPYPNCNVICETYRGLKNHFIYSHYCIKGTECPLCHKKFITERSLELHIIRSKDIDHIVLSALVFKGRGISKHTKNLIAINHLSHNFKLSFEKINN